MYVLVSLVCIVKWRIDGGVNRLVVQNCKLCKIVSSTVFAKYTLNYSLYYTVYDTECCLRVHLF